MVSWTSTTGISADSVKFRGSIRDITGTLMVFSHVLILWQMIRMPRELTPSSASLGVSAVSLDL